MLDGRLMLVWCAACVRDFGSRCRNAHENYVNSSHNTGHAVAGIEV